MFKVFWVGEEEAHTREVHTGHTSHDHVHTGHDVHSNIDVHISDEAGHEDDIGQIALDVLDMHTEIVIVAPIAGVPIDDIDISLARNIITISGDRIHSPLYVDARKTLVEECFYGAFSRSIILPENLAFDAIKAKMENHTLYIHIPKLTFNSANIAIERG